MNGSPRTTEEALVKGYKRERQPGVWEFEVYVGLDPVTGKQVYRYKTFRGKVRAAETALASFLAECAAEKTPATEATLAYLLEQWMVRVRRDRSPTTYDEYRRLVDHVIVPAIGKVRLRDLTARHLDALYDSESERGLAAGSVGQIHAIIRRALNQALKWGWVQTNVAMLATPPARTKRKMTPPTVQSLQLLLAQAELDDARLSVAIRLAAAGGLRRGELCGLQWPDLNLKQGKLHVHQAVVEVRSKVKGRSDVIVKDTKGHGERVLSLDEPTVDLLKAYRRRVLAAAKLYAPAGMARGAFMLSPDPDGRRPTRPDWMSDHFAKVRKDAGLDGQIWLHGLRHLNGSLMLAAGVPLATASGRLGHSYQGTTMGFYSHSMPGTDGQAAFVLGQLLGDTGLDDDEPKA